MWVCFSLHQFQQEPVPAKTKLPKMPTVKKHKDDTANGQILLQVARNAPRITVKTLVCFFFSCLPQHHGLLLGFLLPTDRCHCGITAPYPPAHFNCTNLEKTGCAHIWPYLLTLWSIFTHQHHKGSTALSHRAFCRRHPQHNMSASFSQVCSQVCRQLKNLSASNLSLPKSVLSQGPHPSLYITGCPSPPLSHAGVQM